MVDLYLSTTSNIFYGLSQQPKKYWSVIIFENAHSDNIIFIISRTLLAASDSVSVS